jgi:Xaa-Pro aminopeptidase
MNARAAVSALLLLACADRPPTSSPAVSFDAAGPVHLEEAAIPHPAPPGPAPTTATAEPRGLVSPRGTLGIEVYRRRRLALMNKLGGTPALVMNRMSYDGSRNDADFYYLTGLDVPGAALLLVPQAPIFKEFLFMPQHDPEEERWEGERAELPSKALEVATGIAKIYRVSAIPYGLGRACDRYGALAYVGDLGLTPAPEVEHYQKVTGARLSCSIKDLHGTLARMRVVKEPEELALLRKAIEHTAAGHTAARAATRAGAREYDVKDSLEEAFRKSGSRHLAFDSIVGSGPNSAILHYPHDDRQLKDGELVVIDIGAEAELYAADITRTLPVGGTFSPRQREVYEVVLRAQQAGIDRARAGASIDQIDQVTRKVIEDAGFYDHYLHTCCHYVGLEVHDVGDTAAPLPVGAVITVEPGIYLQGEALGVRIEDMVLITGGDAEVLTSGVPKKIEDVERLMKEQK